MFEIMLLINKPQERERDHLIISSLFLPFGKANTGTKLTKICAKLISVLKASLFPCLDYYGKVE